MSRTVYLDGPEGLLTLVNPDPRAVDRLEGEFGYEEITAEEFSERADSRKTADAETHDGHA